MLEHLYHSHMCFMVLESDQRSKVVFNFNDEFSIITFDDCVTEVLDVGTPGFELIMFPITAELDAINKGSAEVAVSVDLFNFVSYLLHNGEKTGKILGTTLLMCERELCFHVASSLWLASFVS